MPLANGYIGDIRLPYHRWPVNLHSLYKVGIIDLRSDRRSSIVLFVLQSISRLHHQSYKPVPSNKVRSKRIVHLLHPTTWMVLPQFVRFKDQLCCFPIKDLLPHIVLGDRLLAQADFSIETVQGKTHFLPVFPEPVDCGVPKFFLISISSSSLAISIIFSR